MRRREFITLLGGAAAWPLTARAQQLSATIGFLSLGSPEGEASFVTAFRKGLSEGGYVEGRNVAIEFRWAQNDVNRLPELAADLVRRRVDAIVVPTATPGALAARAATATIPIIFRVGFDPVRSGLVTSLNRPGGNITGVSALSQQVVTKRLGLLNELKAGRGPIAALVNPIDDPGAERTVAELRAASETIGRPIEIFFAHTNREIDVAFENMAQNKVEGVLIGPSSLFSNRIGHIAILAARYGLPTIHGLREFPIIGGLMSYGASISDQLRQVGLYAARILKGEKPADLPVIQSSKFEFIINMQTARTLRVTVPDTLLARADEVIE